MSRTLLTRAVERCAFPIVIAALLLLVLVPRTLDLTAHWSSDEALWLLRSHAFITGLREGNLEDTLQAYHPGVTTMWLAGAALFIAEHTQPAANSLISITNLARARLPLRIASAALILLTGLLLYRLLGRATGVVGVFILGLDPFLLSESRRLHTDSLAAILTTLTLLNWLLYLEGRRSRRSVVLAGICFGFACLSKSLSLGFLLFLPLLLGWYIHQRSAALRRLGWAMALWMGCAALTVLVAWPYLWVVKVNGIPLSLGFGSASIAVIYLASLRHDQAKTKSSVYLGVTLSLALVGMAVLALRPVLAGLQWASTTPHETPQLFLGKITYLANWSYYPMYWFVWSSPLMALLVAYGLWSILRNRDTEPRDFRVGVGLLLFGLFYLLGLTFVAKRMARYLLISFPVWDALAAIGLASLIRTMNRFRPAVAYAGLLAVLMFQTTPVLSLHPYYRAYHHPLLSSDWVVRNTSVGGGVGLDLAAAYLNLKPNADKLMARITGFGSFFRHYFVGQTYTTYDKQASWWPDYDVIYIRDTQVGRWPKELPRSLEHIVEVNGIDYVWIYRVAPPRKLGKPLSGLSGSNVPDKQHGEIGTSTVLE